MFVLWLWPAAAVLGGLLWVIKGAAILLGHEQPEYAFELAPLLFAFVTLSLARQVPAGRARGAGVALAATGVLGCLIATVSVVVSGHVLGPDLLVGVLATTAALVVLGRELCRVGMSGGRPAFVLGVATIPAVFVGGALSVIDEQLLELPIVALGLAWVAFGVVLRRPIPPPASPG